MSCIYLGGSFGKPFDPNIEQFQFDLRCNRDVLSAVRVDVNFRYIFVISMAELGLAICYLFGVTTFLWRTSNKCTSGNCIVISNRRL